MGCRHGLYLHVLAGSDREGELGRAEGGHAGGDVRPGPPAHHEDIGA